MITISLLDPEKCPVWQFHLVYSDEMTRDWVQEGCKSAGIGCIDCKGPVIEAVKTELKGIHERAEEYENDPAAVRSIVNEGSENAREIARETIEEVRKAMGLLYK